MTTKLNKYSFIEWALGSWDRWPSSWTAWVSIADVLISKEVVPVFWNLVIIAITCWIVDCIVIVRCMVQAAFRRSTPNVASTSVEVGKIVIWSYSVLFERSGCSIIVIIIARCEIGWNVIVTVVRRVARWRLIGIITLFRWGGLFIATCERCSEEWLIIWCSWGRLVRWARSRLCNSLRILLLDLCHLLLQLI